jgi:hypothetical protein
MLLPDTLTQIDETVAGDITLGRLDDEYLEVSHGNI